MATAPRTVESLHLPSDFSGGEIDVTRVGDLILSFYRFRGDSGDTAKLATALNLIQSVTGELRIEGLRKEVQADLIAALQRIVAMESLQTLTLIFCDHSAANKDFLDSIAGNQSLTKLKLRHGCYPVESLATFLSSASLTELEIECAVFVGTPVGLTQLCAAVDNSSIRVLSLRLEHSTHLLTHFSTCSKLKSLVYRCSNNREMSALSTVLPSLHYLEVLKVVTPLYVPSRQKKDELDAAIRKCSALCVVERSSHGRELLDEDHLAKIALWVARNREIRLWRDPGTSGTFPDLSVMPTLLHYIGSSLSNGPNIVYGLLTYGPLREHLDGADLGQKCSTSGSKKSRRDD